MNSLTVTAKNFQIYNNLNITFNEGITTLTGSSMSGKSAILRMIQTLTLNPAGNTEDINHDAETMQIILKFNIDKNPTVAVNNTNPVSNLQNIEKEYLYQRSINSSVTYKVNNIEFNKIGRDNIYSIDQFFPLTLDDNENILNIQDEWTIMFPFDRKDAGLFKLFEDIFAIIDSSIIIKEFNSQQLQLLKEIKEKENQITQTNKKINLIMDFITQSSLVNDYQIKIINISNNLETINKIKNIPTLQNILINTYKKITVTYEKLKILNKINLNTATVKIIKLQDKYSINKKYSNLITIHNQIKLSTELNKLNPAYINPNKYINILERYKTIQELNVAIMKMNSINSLNIKNINSTDIFEKIKLTNQLIIKINCYSENKNKLEILYQELNQTLIDNENKCPLCNNNLISD